MTSEYRRSDRNLTSYRLQKFCEDFMQQQVEDPDLYYVEHWQDPGPAEPVCGHCPVPDEIRDCGTPVSDNELFIPWCRIDWDVVIDDEFVPDDIRGVSSGNGIDVTWHVSRVKCSRTGITVNFDGDYSLASPSYDGYEYYEHG